MKTITFIRHAKSDHSMVLSDQKRPLNERGRKEAALISRFLQHNMETPDVMLCSIAIRARETCEIMRDSGLFPQVTLHYETDLYTFDGDGLIRFLRGLDNAWSKVIVFGHNPAFSEACERLLGIYPLHLKTSAVQSIAVDTALWENILQKKGVSLLKAHPHK